MSHTTIISENGINVCLLGESYPLPLSYGYVKRPNGFINSLVRSPNVKELARGCLAAEPLLFETSNQRFRVTLLNTIEAGHLVTSNHVSIEHSLCTCLLVERNSGRTYSAMIWRELRTLAINHDQVRADPPMPLPEVARLDKHCLVVDLGNPVAEADQVGGKSQQLMILKRLQNEAPSRLSFTVPDGFAITTSAFEAHIQNNEMAQLQRKLQMVLSQEDSTRDDRAKVICAEIRRLINDHPFSPELVSLVSSCLDDLNRRSGGTNGRYAVRSSASDEDGTESSSAGQELTVLGVRGETEEVMHALKRCWSSHYEWVAVSYRHHNGVPLFGSMGVVIQRMVDAAAAGVLFTWHPVTLNPARMLINANLGLGESVVSGQADPDTFVVARRPPSADSSTSITGDMHIIERRLGSKQHVLKLINDDTSERSVNGSHKGLFEVSGSAAEVSLSDEVVLQLAALGDWLERRFRSPRDIEFAISNDGQVFLLQARPITNLDDELDDEELRYELDSPVGADNTFWTRANVQEVMWGARTPLTITLFDQRFMASANCIRLFMDRTADTLVTDANNLFGSFKRLVFLNFSGMLSLMGSDRNIRAAEVMFAGHEYPEITPDHLLDYNGTMSFSRKMRRLFFAVLTRRLFGSPAKLVALEAALKDRKYSAGKNS